MKTSLFFNSKEIQHPKGKFDLYYGIFRKYYDNESARNLDSQEKQQIFLNELLDVIADNDFDIENKLNYMATLMETVHFGTCLYLPDSK